jgi:hypothetical protein
MVEPLTAIKNWLAWIPQFHRDHLYVDEPRKHFARLITKKRGDVSVV